MSCLPRCGVGLAIIAGVCASFLATRSQAVSAGTDETAALVQETRSSDRNEWWPAVARLGEIARESTELKSRVWSSARVNTLGMKFAEIEPGAFTMGPDVHRVFDRQPAHRVIISQGYFISITEVTNEQMQRVLSDYVPNSFSPESDGPAVGITWEMAVQFCERLSQLEQTVYRLPTEAEWEYACRAGTTTLFSFGDSKRELAEYGWYRNESGGRAARVAMLKPNAWGLFDMHGNAAEWVSDWYTHSYYSKLERAGEVRDPKGPDRGWSHVLRSGGWPAREPLSCSSAARMPFPLLGGFSARKNTPPLAAVVGFRIVRERELSGEF